jgi:hypothetical protein
VSGIQRLILEQLTQIRQRKKLPAHVSLEDLPTSNVASLTCIPYRPCFSVVAFP